jgi:hypothetical protein
MKKKILFCSWKAFFVSPQNGVAKFWLVRKRSFFFSEAKPKKMTRLEAQLLSRE